MIVETDERFCAEGGGAGGFTKVSLTSGFSSGKSSGFTQNF